jgi:hypothetical protein
MLFPAVTAGDAISRAQRHDRLPGLHRPAFHVGTATGSDGRQYNLETDMRAMAGTYVAEDGSRQRRAGRSAGRMVAVRYAISRIL